MKPAELNILGAAEGHLQASAQRQLAKVWTCLAVSHYQQEGSMPPPPSSASFLPTWTNRTSPATTSCLKTHKGGRGIKTEKGLFLEDLSINSSQGDFVKLMGTHPTLPPSPATSLTQMHNGHNSPPNRDYQGKCSALAVPARDSTWAGVCVMRTAGALASWLLNNTDVRVKNTVMPGAILDLNLSLHPPPLDLPGGAYRSSVVWVRVTQGRLKARCPRAPCTCCRDKEP